MAKRIKIESYGLVVGKREADGRGQSQIGGDISAPRARRQLCFRNSMRIRGGGNSGGIGYWGSLEQAVPRAKSVVGTRRNE